jgi:hypothetical protein
MKRTNQILTFITLLLVGGGMYASIGKLAQTSYTMFESLVIENDRSENDYFFPVLLESTKEATLNSFVSAVIKCDTSVLARQKAIKLVEDSIPNFTDMSKPLSDSTGVQTKVLNRYMISMLKGRPTDIQLLFNSNAFLGKDTPETYRKSQEELEKRKKGKVERPLSANVNENIQDNIKPSEEAEKRKLMTRCRKLMSEKIARNNAAILSEQFNAPVFIESQLFKDSFLDEEERPYEYAFRFLIFCSAYPKVYAKMSPKIKNMLLSGSWTALYRFGKNNLNPEKNQDQIARYLKMYQS